MPDLFPTPIPAGGARLRPATRVQRLVTADAGSATARAGLQGRGMCLLGEGLGLRRVQGALRTRNGPR